jgi:2-oxoglutarate/2-oxoacid ferredoxin oxidoreductase subunit alpha
MEKTLELKKEVTILFAGDSGDGIQLTGNQFTNTNALFGNDVSTFPNFPAEIRAPQGTVAGVSGFQLNFGSVDLFSPGDMADVLVVMNAAALKANLVNLKVGGTIIANSSGFDKKNLKLAGYKDENPIQAKSLDKYRVHEVDVTKLTRTALIDSGLGTKEIDRSKNMFVLGFLYWMYSRSLDQTVKFIEEKFRGKQNLIDANIKVLKAGYHYGDTSETFTSRYDVKPADLPKGTYRNVMGNQATALGIVAAANRSNLELLYASYPITPASDILHELARHKNFGVKTFQAEDEIAAAGAAIGAAFGGALAVTASSGPGIALKTEAIGLAVMLELPMVIINVQRGGPSTGLPTKTEQSDLFQALYGRNGEAQIVVVAANSPSDCFDSVYESCRIAVEHMTPVIFLSDGYMANGSEPWSFPKSTDLKPIKPKFKEALKSEDEKFLPYERDENLVRQWATPGTPTLEHRIGGLEKEKDTGNVSYDPDNHEYMVKIRAEKIAKIANHIPEQGLAAGEIGGDVLVLGWGSTYGSIKTAVKELIDEGHKVAHAHLTYINPMPKNIEGIIKSFKKVIIPELNDAQMVNIIRSKFLVPAIPYNKIKGMPFTVQEIKSKVLEVLVS